MPRYHLAQGREIVFQNLVESMRDQFVVHIGEHIANFVVPSLHCPVKLEVLFSKVGKVLLHSLELRLPAFCVGGAMAPSADLRVLEHQRYDAVEEYLLFLAGVLACSIAGRV